MTSDRVFRLVTVAAVLLVATYASRAGLAPVLAVAVVGLAAARWRTVLGIPVSVGAAAACIDSPVVVTGLVLVVAAFFLLLTFAVKLPEQASSDVDTHLL
jgi:hypothetical protein